MRNPAQVSEVESVAEALSEQLQHPLQELDKEVEGRMRVVLQQLVLSAMRYRQ